ncbi:hepcidin [Pseudophryne corroboree]|uniref:hepcidin n=1 Tax=Pseudophryne corroboree TaxID=495146 RepID=UPI0030819F48
MKAFVLCVLLILSVLGHRSLGVSLRGNEIENSADHLAQSQTEEYAAQESHTRDKRHIGLGICTYCCKCCANKGCGYCCRT